MAITIDFLLSKHCSCKNSDNKIIIETVSVCPECFVFFSQVIAQIPSDQVHAVLEKIIGVIDEMGLLNTMNPAVVETGSLKREYEHLS